MMTRTEVEEIVYTDLRARYLSTLITNNIMIESLNLAESGVDATTKRTETNRLETQNVILEAQIKLVEKKLKELDGKKLQKDERTSPVGEKPKSDKAGEVRGTQK